MVNWSQLNHILLSPLVVLKWPCDQLPIFAKQSCFPFAMLYLHSITRSVHLQHSSSRHLVRTVIQCTTHQKSITAILCWWWKHEHCHHITYCNDSCLINVFWHACKVICSMLYNSLTTSEYSHLGTKNWVEIPQWAHQVKSQKTQPDLLQVDWGLI